VQRWNFESTGPGFDYRLEHAASELGLHWTRYLLKSQKHNIHWHFRVPGKAGTLEATWLIDTGEAWLSLRANRQADWAVAAANMLVKKT